MGALETVVYVVGGVVFIAWILSTYAWTRRGCPMPKWLHLVALACFVVGAGLGVHLVVRGGRPIGLAFACGLGFPAAMYVGWLWTFGPDWAEKR